LKELFFLFCQKAPVGLERKCNIYKREKIHPCGGNPHFKGYLRCGRAENGIIMAKPCRKEGLDV